MQWTALFATAGLTVSTANAFLVPSPEVFEGDSVNALPIDVESPGAPDSLIKATNLAESASVKLNCPGCPVQVGRHHGKGDDSSLKIKTDIPSHLELEFQIDHASEYDRLTVNGFSLYPTSDALHTTLGAKLVPDFKGKHHKSKHSGEHQEIRDHKEHKDHKDHKDHQKTKEHGEHKDHKGHKDHKDRKPEPLGFQLQTKTFPESTEDHLQLIQLDLQIMEVGNVFVEDVPSVLIKLIKTPEGGLMIGDMTLLESEIAQKNPMDKQEECTTLLCKWRAIIMQQLARIHGGQPCPAHRKPGQVAGQHSGHHGHHGQGEEDAREGMPAHGKHHRHRWSHLLKNIASHILLPIAVGIAAGVTASVIGMMVGTAIVYVWRLFFRPASARRARHGVSAHKAAQSEVAASEEKAGLMAYEDEVEAPPAYVEDRPTESPKSTENEA
ncbi:hypothetical protein BX600DRAFT_512992 [Xylariales sp. PMI_506]|nr:hypothetical protein BX600DRAFT_512992 [Xylariales sp. PMI_506]